MQVLHKAQDIIETLKSEVEFPDVRSLVNAGKLSFANVLAIRKKAKRFRDWLQTESERDRNAIIAYHNEAAREGGLVGMGRKALKLFSVIGGAAGGAAIETAVGGAVGGVVGATLGGGAGYVIELASQMNAGWKPVVFGNWMEARIAELVTRRQKQSEGMKGPLDWRNVTEDD